ncbi:MAG: hypothetical protein EXR72_02965 [Myxococcales bacterium]|nr:hypothetical protein [Myxococcales bacterium]
MLKQQFNRLKDQIRNSASSRPWLTPWVARARGIKQPTLMVKGKRFSIVCGPREFRAPWGVDREGCYEGPFVERMVEEVEKHGQAVFFDVGGAVGFDALVADAFGAKDIHVFEPSPLAIFFLKQNLRGVRHTLNPLFVGDHDDERTITLDTYCRRRDVAPTHIKLDIEGHEIFCLAGMTEVLKRHRPMLFIEFHERIIRDELKLGDAAVDNFFKTLDGLGYTMKYNGHQYEMVTGGTQLYNYTWHDQPPHHVNFAIVATPR